MAKTKRRPARWSRAPEKLVNWLKGYQIEKELQDDGIPGVQTVDQFRLDHLARNQPDDPGCEAKPVEVNIWHPIAIGFVIAVLIVLAFYL